MMYESTCRKCGKEFDYIAAVADRDTARPSCCGKKTERVIRSAPSFGSSTPGHLVSIKEHEQEAERVQKNMVRERKATRKRIIERAIAQHST